MTTLRALTEGLPGVTCAGGADVSIERVVVAAAISLREQAQG